jgi:hypothetical protein
VVLEEVLDQLHEVLVDRRVLEFVLGRVRENHAVLVDKIIHRRRPQRAAQELGDKVEEKALFVERRG